MYIRVILVKTYIVCEEKKYEKCGKRLDFRKKTFFLIKNHFEFVIIMKNVYYLKFLKRKNFTSGLS